MKKTQIRVCHENFVQQLLRTKKIPEHGWDSRSINYILSYLSSMDCNNFPSKANVGEREGRCFSELVARRNFYFIHGIGRSGNLTEPQPKAVGSSILYKLTTELLKDLLPDKAECLLIPTPIGITLSLCLNTFRLIRKGTDVLWFREDNEIIFNSIINAGFTPIILTSSDKKLIKAKIEEVGSERIACVISASSSTSLSVPRESHSMKEIGEICYEYSLPHIINNDCGLQNRSIMEEINKDYDSCRIDVIIQNAGENFMVPVGSTLITSKHLAILDKIANVYPGRASSSSVIDIFITLLSLGRNGYNELIDKREDTFRYFNAELTRLYESYKEFIVSIHSTQMSIALCFRNDFPIDSPKVNDLKNGCRVIKMNIVTKLETKVLGKHEFNAWGGNGYSISTPCISFQIPIGTSKEEAVFLIENFEAFLNIVIDTR